MFVYDQRRTDSYVQPPRIKWKYNTLVNYVICFWLIYDTQWWLLLIHFGRALFFRIKNRKQRVNDRRVFGKFLLLIHLQLRMNSSRYTANALWKFSFYFLCVSKVWIKKIRQRNAFNEDDRSCASSLSARILFTGCTWVYLCAYYVQKHIGLYVLYSQSIYYNRIEKSFRFRVFVQLIGV